MKKILSFVLSLAMVATMCVSMSMTAFAAESDLSTPFEVKTITAVGNGDGAWLNGAYWDPADTSNDLTEIATGVWQITYTGIAAYDNYQVKFAVNHGWEYSWTSDGVFDGSTNPSLTVEADNTTVTLTIDVNNYDFDTKTGSVKITLGGFYSENSNTDANSDKTADIKGTYVAGSSTATVYSVDVAWGSMEFTYTDASQGTWNPETHKYDGATTGAWSNETDANKITVTNHSNAAVDATLSYINGASYAGITGSFTEASSTANDGKLSLATADGTTFANAPTASAALNLSGALASDTTVKSIIGTVSITISAPEIGGGSEGPDAE